LVEDEERVLLVHLASFGDVISESATIYEPALVTRYLQELAQLFNAYYQKYSILTDDSELTKARVALVA